MPDRRRHLRPNPHTLGVTPLSQGDASDVVRVRCNADALAAFVALSPVERGAIVNDWHTTHTGEHNGR
jgi:hypothetical protein